MQPSSGQRGEPAFALDTNFVLVSDGRFRAPAGCTYIELREGSSSKTVSQISSIYDYRSAFKVQSTVSVGDATGELVKTSLSASYEEVRSMMTKQNRVITQSVLQMRLFKLSVVQDRTALAPELLRYLTYLPATVGREHDMFFERFGTHYSQAVVFGGRVSQASSVSRDEYERSLQQGVTLKSSGTATIEGVQVSGEHQADMTDTRRTEQASSFTADRIRVTGGEGVPTSSTDFWDKTVDDKPAAIEIELKPLYELLVPRYFPDDTNLPVRRKALEDATRAYLTAHGHPLDESPLQVGDRVTLALAGSARPRPLSSTREFASTPVLATNDDGRAASRVWTIGFVDANGAVTTTPSGHPDTDRFDDARIIALVAGDGLSVLDAQSGSDATYAIGDGLTGVSANGGPSSRWSVTHVTETGRSEIVDGDYLKFQSQWLYSATDEPGFLLGETNADDPAQRVYSFGQRDQPGCVWRITRVDVHRAGA
jgi:MAC/Perforin domain